MWNKYTSLQKPKQNKEKNQDKIGQGLQAQECVCSYAHSNAMQGIGCTSIQWVTLWLGGGALIGDASNMKR
eukprot:15358774-Ditylum_brightwellii.AAC.1